MTGSAPGSLVANAIAYIGHEVHVMRRREVGTLLSWAGDLTGRRLLDVAGGDGFWAAKAAQRGATAVCLDLSRPKLSFGAKLHKRPGLVEGDAQWLPFADGTFDVVMSVCAIEHFDDGPRSLDEMARVLRPGGSLVMSADALTRSEQWPELMARHRERYHVKSTYRGGQLRALLAARGLEVIRQTYMFRSARAEHLYLGLSAHGGKLGWNAAAALSPLVAASDRRNKDDGGSVVLTHARKRAGT